jgi:hypothetical protein
MEYLIQNMKNIFGSFIAIASFSTLSAQTTEKVSEKSTELNEVAIIKN